MSYLPRHSILACALLIVLVGATGCLGITSQSELPDGDTVSESLGAVESVEGELSFERQVGNDTIAYRMEFVQRLTTGEFRATVHWRSPDSTLEMVSNGSTMWVHNRTADTVRTVDIEGIGTGWNRSVESVSEMFDSLEKSSSDEDVSISPLPAVPGGGSGTAAGAVGAGSLPSTGNLSLTYQGTTTAVGGEAHAVDIEPTTNQSLIRNGTIWFDADRYFPIKTEYAASISGQPAEITTEYRNLTYNPTVEVGTFTFEPPANATVEDDSRAVSMYQSRADLVDDAETSVPQPALPEGYQFAEGSITTEGANATVTMHYSSDEGSVVVSKRTPGRDDPPWEANVTVDVAGHEGSYRETGGTAALSWQCDGSEYTVAGRLSKSELRSVAESMACA